MDSLNICCWTLHVLNVALILLEVNLHVVKSNIGEAKWAKVAYSIVPDNVCLSGSIVTVVQMM
jgi:hypothetical protein